MLLHCNIASSKAMLSSISKLNVIKDYIHYEPEVFKDARLPTDLSDKHGYGTSHVLELHVFVAKTYDLYHLTESQSKSGIRTQN